MVYLTEKDLRSQITNQSIIQSFNDLESPEEAMEQQELWAIDEVYNKISQKFDLNWEVKLRPIIKITNNTYPSVIYAGQRFIKDNLIKVAKYDLNKFYNSTANYKVDDEVFLPPNKIFKCVASNPIYYHQDIIGARDNIITPSFGTLPFNQQFKFDRFFQYDNINPTTNPEFFIEDDRNPTLIKFISSIFIFFMCDRVMRIETPEGIKTKFDRTMSSLKNIMKTNEETIYGLLNQQPVQEKIVTSYAFPAMKRW